MFFLLSWAYAIAQWLKTLAIAAAAALGLGFLLGWFARRKH